MRHRILGLTATVALLAGQTMLPSDLPHRACRYWRVFEAVRTSDTQTNLVETMIYSLFFAEAGWPPARTRSINPT